MDKKSSKEIVEFLNLKVKNLERSGYNPYVVEELKSYLKEFTSATTEKQRGKALTKFFLTVRELQETL